MLKRNTRMFRWRFKRLEMENTKEALQMMLLKTSEELMKVHSDLSNGLLTKTICVNERTLDDLFDDPISQIEKMMEIAK